MVRNKSPWTLGPVLVVIVMATELWVPGAWAQSKFKTLHRFSGQQDGSAPAAGLIFDQTGNLYGTTPTGGNGLLPFGTVFKLTANSDGSWTESVLYNFCSLTHCTDGSLPEAGLVFDQAGNLYGTTEQGAGGWGSVFELTPNADGIWTEKVIHSFAGTDGEYPMSGLIFDQAGNLYGTTYMGTPNHSGTVFKLTPNADGTWSESVLYSFCSHRGCRGGSSPAAGLIFDQVGNLYGTTVAGAARPVVVGVGWSSS
jgi:uncharacterized repeat protein (TIGR03803 family)